jgi:hypothetical protein
MSRRQFSTAHGAIELPLRTSLFIPGLAPGQSNRTSYVNVAKTFYASQRSSRSGLDVAIETNDWERVQQHRVHH